MARRVFFHIGLPKTGTSYLQSVLWAHAEELRAAGLLLPGRERRDHLWASGVVRGDPRLARRHPRAPEAWQILQDQIAAWDDDAVISHEFFASASAQQARDAVAVLAPAEVHLVVTAREPLGLFTASWQESVKNRSQTPLDDYGRAVSDDPLKIWNWRCLDLRLVLDRWGDVVPADRVHIVTAPGREAPHALLWDRFAGVLGIDPATCQDGCGFPNRSLGVAETETLRRLNGRLLELRGAHDRGVWIRSYLAEERLAPRGGESYWPAPAQVEDARRRGEGAVTMVRDRGFDVVGELDSLRVPDDLPDRRHPRSVTDSEVAEVALDLAADLVRDVRRLTHELEASRGTSAGAARDTLRARLALRTRARRLLDGWRGDG